MVVAESADQARAAAELIEVDYDELPCVVDTLQAGNTDAPVLFHDFATNIAFEWERGERAKVDAIFRKAAHVTRVNLSHNRVIVAAMELRGALAIYAHQTITIPCTPRPKGPAWFILEWRLPFG